MLKTIGTWHDRLSQAGLWLGMLALAALAGLSFAGTLARYLFASPIAWVPDWAGYILAASIFVTVPAVTRDGQHVAMDFLAASMRPGLSLRVVTVVATAITVAILVTMSWIVWDSLTLAYRRGTGTAAGYPIPRWWLLSFILYGFGSSALHVLRALIGLLTARSTAPVPTPLSKEQT